MGVNGIDRKADGLYVSLVPFGLELGHGAQFGGADRGEVLRVAEQHAPRVAEPVVKLDLALGGLGGEVWGNISETN